MLTIYSQDGVDLLLVPPATVNVDLTTANGTPYQVAVAAVEDDLGLGARLVSGRIDWNDGNHVDNFDYSTSSAGTLAMVATQMLAPGDHTISVYARNYRAPEGDEVTVNFRVNVLVPPSNTSGLRYLYGPILPKDSGYPNAQQWNFNSDVDLAVLASSVKMLLETQPGERIMLPTYGADLRSLLFDPSITGIETLIQERITQALTTWEPRVSIVNVVITRNANRSVSVYMTLVSRLSQQQFEVSTTITQ